MITVDENLIDNITESIFNLLNGVEIKPVNLPEDYPENEIRQMIKYLNLLINQINLTTDSVNAFSSGNLQFELPRGNNKLLYALKDLQSHLLHLTWQTQQIANGDYNQKVDFMGEFSIAFNSMTEQLKSAFDEIKKKNFELSESEKKLKEAIAMKDKFFSIIAHDLRNPIGAVMSMMEVMLQSIDMLSTEKLIELLLLNKTSAERTYKLLENLLSWARSQQGLIPFNPKTYDISLVIDENISTLSTIAQNKSIRLYCESKESVLAYFDHDMISTVIRNLISNALKFTNENGEVKLSLTETQEYVQISVSDNGIGISENNLQKIFRLDDTLSTSGTKGEKGSGLGLILCKEFVEKNNGKICVESKFGKGTTFFFTLPKSKNSRKISQ